MTLNEVKNNCYTCQHRESALESDYSSCKHPWLAGENAAVAQHMVMQCGRCKMINGEQELFVKIGEHGIMHGWANWPIEYDPIWVKECSVYQSV